MVERHRWEPLLREEARLISVHVEIQNCQNFIRPDLALTHITILKGTVLILYLLY